MDQDMASHVQSEFEAQVIHVILKHEALKKAQAIEEKRRVSEARAKRRIDQEIENRKCELQSGIILFCIAAFIAAVAICLEQTGNMTRDYTLGTGGIVLLTSIFATVSICGCKF